MPEKLSPLDEGSRAGGPADPQQAVNIRLRDADDRALEEISRARGLGLDRADMRVIQTYFREAAREPGRMELEILSQVWNALAELRILSGIIEYDGPPPGPDGYAPAVHQSIDGLLQPDAAQAGIDMADLLRDDAGEWTNDGRWQVRREGQLVCDLPRDFLTYGWPRQSHKAIWRAPALPDEIADTSSNESATREVLLAVLAQIDPQVSTEVTLLADNSGPTPNATFDFWPDLLGSPSLAVDQSFGWATVTTGAPLYGELDPYRMAWAAVDRAVGALVSGGADPRHSLLRPTFEANDPSQPEHLGALLRAIQGFEDAALKLDSPTMIDGDPLRRISVRPVGGPASTGTTLRIAALAELPAGSPRPAHGFKQVGNFIFVVGKTRPELGGSLYGAVGGRIRPQHSQAPGPVTRMLDRQQALHQSICAELTASVIPCGAGGIGVALARLCAAGNVGADIQMRTVPVDPYYAYAADEAILFSESLGRYLVEVRPEDAAAFAEALDVVARACIGVVGGSDLRVHPRLPSAADPWLSIEVAALRRALGSGGPSAAAK